MRVRNTWHMFCFIVVLLVVGILSASCGGGVPVAQRSGAVHPTTSSSTTTIPPTTTTSVTPSVAPAPLAPPIQVAVFGDSLITNSFPYVVQDLGAITTPGHILPTVIQTPGAALCHFLSQMQTVATTIHPQVVVIEFAGNSFEQCIATAMSQGFPAVVAQYQADLETAISTFLANGTEHFIVLIPPPGSPTSPYANLAPYSEVQNMYRSFVPSLNNPAVTVFDASPWIEDPVTHGYTQYMPCKPVEIWSGDCTGPVINEVQNDPVHYADGTHLCAAMTAFVCDGYASGAWRLANAIATAVALSFSPHYGPLPPGP